MLSHVKLVEFPTGRMVNGMIVPGADLINFMARKSGGFVCDDPDIEAPCLLVIYMPSLHANHFLMIPISADLLMNMINYKISYRPVFIPSPPETMVGGLVQL